MNPRKLLALALVLVLAVISTGVFAYAQNADDEPTPSATAVLPESNAPETSVVPEVTNAAAPVAAAETQEPTEEPAGDETQEPTEEPAGDETQEPTEEPADAETQEPTEEPETTPDAEPTETAPAEVQTLFDRLMACTSCEEMYELLNSADLADVEALETDDLTAVIDFANTLEDDGFQTDLVFDLTVLRDGETDELLPGGGDHGGSENECSQSYYQASAQVYYDTMTYDASNDTGTTYPAGRSYIKSVTIGSTTVKQADATRPSKASGGSNMSTYFSGASTSTEKTNTLSITPAEGYYVTAVVIACTGGNNQSAFECNTWNDKNAFHTTFSVGTSGTVSINVSSRDFSHRSESKKVFVLIALAPVPTPLYVEYWPGEITDHTTDTVFKTSAAWTNADSRNVYGTGVVDTNDTQFKYAYSTNSSEAGNWKHYANNISAEAVTAAANAGYYFAGWKVEYFTSASATKREKNDENDREYTYNLSNSYGTGATAQPGDAVHLTTNCKLTALWLPIELKVTKQVSGLEGDFLTDHTYRIQVQKQNADGSWDNYGNVQSLTVNGNGSATATLSGVTPGIYRAVEVDESRGDLTANGKTMYVTVTDSGTVTYGTTPGATSQELVVKNDYTATAPAYNLTVKKTLSGNMYSENDRFTFTVKYGDVTETFELGNNGSKVISVPVGATVTVTENPDNFEYSLTSVSPNTLSYESVNDGVTFTMPAEDVEVVINNHKEMTITTGVLLDRLPYILILAAVVIIGVAAFVRKRHGRDD